MSKRDERIVQRDERLESEARQPVEAQLNQDTLRGDPLPVSSSELEVLLREEALASALPSPPQIPGWHQVWLSTTNTYTPIQQYVRLGYVPVRPEEHREWQYLKQHSAQQAHEVVSCNEMVLYKIPDEAYQQIMRVIHHDRPNEEAERLRANVQMMKQGDDFRDSKGMSLVREEGDGYTDDERHVRAPGRFT